MPSEVNRLSNREDYLDSLLKSVAGPEERERKSMSAISFEDSLAAGINPEDDFLMKYDQEFFDLDGDDFLKEFENGLGEEAAIVGDDFDLGVDSSIGSKTKGAPMDFGQDFDSMEINTMEQSDMPSMDYDSILESAGDTLFDGGMEVDTLGDMDTISASDSDVDSDVDAILKAALGTSDMEELAAMGMDEEKDGSYGAEDANAELFDILSGMSDDSDLTDIGNMLRAHDEDELLAGDELDTFGDEWSENLEEAADSEQEANGKKKRGKKKKADRKNKDEQKKNGVFSKLSAMFFGEDDDIEVPEAAEMGKISDENMKVLKDMEKAEKKKKKKEQKEQKKKEKEEKRRLKEANAKQKPKKEKKPKLPKEPPVKTKPLPKGPVFLIFLMAASIVVLIYLGSSYVGYTSGMTQAEEKYDNGEYVEAYHLLQGMDIKEIDQEFYDKTRLTAYLQKEMDAYEAYADKKMYAEALNVLLCTVGKYDKYIVEASGVGAAQDFDKILEQAVAILGETYQVTLEEAEEVYQLPERDEYTARLYQLLERAGYTE